ncbi:uncharacterized protein [Amphiura filiformis]|uniref:uncharacterized protein n=1 Tax=Amphiura filiformis TaxID=82378 RepID=UPI003B217DA5
MTRNYAGLCLKLRENLSFVVKMRSRYVFRILTRSSANKCMIKRHLNTSPCLNVLRNESSSKKTTSPDELLPKFKDVMRSVPSPVVVVTSSLDEDGQCFKRGVTCSSFTSVSMQPPIISLCITKPSRMHSLMIRTKRFAVNVLAQEQVHYGVHFSTPAKDEEDQFNAIPHTLGLADIPLIDGAAGVLQCQAYDVHTIGDHHVWYGEVLDAHIHGNNGNHPLIYFAKSFHSVGDETFMKAFEDTTLLFEDWTHEAHLRMSWNYVKKYGEEQATPIIRNGIQKYNEQNKEKIERGYHETVTRFYISQVALAIKKCDPNATFEEFLAVNRHLTDRQLLFKYYSEDLINSPVARLRYQAPDLQPLPE